MSEVAASTDDPAAALDQRLRAAATHILSGGAGPVEIGDRSAASLLPALVAAYQGTGDRESLWLLLAAVAGAMPRDEDLRAAARYLELDHGSQAEVRLLDIAFELAADTHEACEVEVVTHSVLADVDFCARRDFHTGIQRVVRETLPRWDTDHEVLPVAWTDTYTCLRRLHTWEVPNVMAYRAGQAADKTAVDGTALLILPLRSTIILPEIPEPDASDCYAALSQWTSNRVVAVGYDMIPIVSADLRPGFEATRFTRYLNAVKHADHVAAISRSATAEFTGFAQALVAQGLDGPVVTEVLLPAAPPVTESAASPVDAAPRTPNERPVIVCVGTHDPHKNHAATVHAAERLWREGLDFELVFMGGIGFRGPDHLCFREVLAAGRPVRNLGRVSDETMTAELRRADFSVFLSLHEGYGLPVAEALACGTPVVTSNFGSLQEIAEGGGCVTVDPRDDDAVTSAIRTLLTDRAALESLRAEIASRPARTWDTYAAELWTVATGDAR